MRRRASKAVICRSATAVLGGYALAAACAVCLSFLLPGPRADAVTTGLLVSFAVYAAAVIWAFAARSLARLWLGLGALTAGFAVLAGVLKLSGAP